MRGVFSRRSVVRTLALMLAAALVGGCVTAGATPESPATPSARTTPTASPTPSPTPTPTPTPTADPLANLGHTPSGPWTSINWVAIPAGHSPTLQAVSPQEPRLSVNLFGWSKGFVDFIWNPATRSIVPWTSPDGPSWTAGTKLDMSELTAGFKAWDEFNAQLKAEGEPPGTCDLEMDGLSEGPASILVVGWIVCDRAPCGSDWYIGPAVWRSTTGTLWSRVNASATGGGDRAISGGSKGYIALSTSGQGRSITISPDGKTWSPVANPSPPADSTLQLNSAASFAGGFVLIGSVDWGKGACAIALDPEQGLRLPAIWWSADGAAWTQEALRGATPDAYPGLGLVRISDRALLATQAAETDLAWTSVDGRTWNPLTEADALGDMTFLTDGARCVGFNSGGGLVSFDDALQLTTLTQTGVPPAGHWHPALGPTGLLVTDDGTQFWIGVPSAG